MRNKYEMREEIITIPPTTRVNHKTPTIDWQTDLLKSVEDMTEHNYCLIIGPALGCLITRLDR